MKAPGGPFPWLDTLAWMSLTARHSVEGSSAHHPQHPYWDFLKASNQALKGFLKYTEAPRAPVGCFDQRIPLWSQGTTTLYGYPDTVQGHPYTHALLCVPSLINSSKIFDGLSQHNLISSLRNQGIQPFLLDWGGPTAEDRDLDMEGVILHKLLPAYDALCQLTNLPLCALGYCLGGTLSLALAHHRPLHRLVLMATPWDFEAYPPWVRAWALGASTLAESLGFLPGMILQQGFQSIQGAGMFKKFQNLSQDPEDPCSDMFLYLEDWLNEPLPLYAGVAQTLLKNWFGWNETGQHRWVVDHKTITPQTISCPTYLIEGLKDQIVPALSSAPLQHIPTMTRRAYETGHVGLMTSRHAPKNLWDPLICWISQGPLRKAS